MTSHEWRDKTAEGKTKLFRANRHASEWEFMSKMKRDPYWEHLDELPLDEMEVFREVLWNKHLRRRVPLKLVEEIDEIIEAQKRQLGNTTPD